LVGGTFHVIATLKLKPCGDNLVPVVGMDNLQICSPITAQDAV
jgi:hypothetical protein